MMGKIRVISDAYNADDLNLLKTGTPAKTKSVVKYAVIGMGLGIGYSLFRGKNILFGMLIGSLSGYAVGEIRYNLIKRNKDA